MPESEPDENTIRVWAKAGAIRDRANIIDSQDFIMQLLMSVTGKIGPQIAEASFR